MTIATATSCDRSTALSLTLALKLGVGSGFREGHGAAVTDLQGVLGHASLTTTQIYAQMADRRTRDSLCPLSL